MQNESYTKLLSVALEQDETPNSFASRLAARNGTTRLIEFCTDMGLSLSGLTQGDPDTLRALARIAGVQSDLLIKHKPRMVERNHYRFGSEQIKSRALQRVKLRYCPLCVADDKARDSLYGPYQRSNWLLTSIRTCHIHHCVLSEIDSLVHSNDCEDTHSRFRVHFAGKNQLTTETIRHDDLVLENYLFGRIRGGEGPDWLNSLQFHVAAQLCENFGLLLIKGADAVRHETTPKEWVVAGAAGFRVLRAGKDALTRKLKQIQNRNPIEYQLYRSKYRVFYQWLRDRDDGPEFDEIRDHVRQFVFDNFPVKPGALVLGVPCSEQKLHTICTASRRYGISNKMLGRCLVDRGLARQVPGSQTPRIGAYIPNAVIEEIVFETVGTMDIGQAARYLDMDRNIVSRLVGQGWISHLVKPGTDWPRFSEIHLKRFVSSLCGKRVDRLPLEKLIDIPTAAHRTRSSIEHIVEMVLTGRLASGKRCGVHVGFKCAGIDLCSLRKLLDPPRDLGLSIGNAAMALNVSTNTVTKLIDADVLKVEKISWPVKDREIAIVTAQSVAEFRSQYVSLAELAATQKRTPGPLAQHLAARNVLPTPVVNGGSRIYFREV